MTTKRLNKSEQAVLEYVRRDGYFTTDPGQRKRLNTAAYTLVRKGVCEIIRRDSVWDETRYSVGGGQIECSRRPFSTIRVAFRSSRLTTPTRKEPSP
jgi:hypothetical protein